MPFGHFRLAEFGPPRQVSPVPSRLLRLAVALPVLSALDSPWAAPVFSVPPLFGCLEQARVWPFLDGFPRGRWSRIGCGTTCWRRRFGCRAGPPRLVLSSFPLVLVLWAPRPCRQARQVEALAAFLERARNRRRSRWRRQRRHLFVWPRGQRKKDNRGHRHRAETKPPGGIPPGWAFFGAGFEARAAGVGGRLGNVGGNASVLSRLPLPVGEESSSNVLVASEGSACLRVPSRNGSRPRLGSRAN